MIHRSIFEIWCRESLEEVGIDTSTISFNTMQAEFTSKTLGLKPMLVPSRIWKPIQNMSKNKVKDFTFKGIIHPNREWIRTYPNVEENYKSKDLELRYNGFDERYYKDMCETKFTLCPPGHEPWSHRLLEAIACYSIPVLGRYDVDVLVGNWFKHYRHGYVKDYDLTWAEHNYEIFLKRHTLYHEFFK